MIGVLAVASTGPIVGRSAEWVDLTILNGILTGVLLLIAGLWGWVLFNRLWQSSLRADAAAGVQAAQDLGLVLRPPGVRARLVARGQVDGREVRIEWRGGVRGARSVVFLADTRTTVPLIDSPQVLHRVLDHEPTVPDAHA